MKIVDSDIFIGCNDEENWNLIDNAHKDDMWYHLDSFPSCHVICNDINKFLDCAQLCKRHSKYRNLPNVKVCYTKIDNLVKGDTVGTVCFKSKRKVKRIVV